MADINAEGGITFGARGLTFGASGLIIGGHKVGPPVKTSGIALEEVKTFVINQYEPIEGGTPFELVINGKPVLFGIGEITDALIDMAIFLEEGHPDTPHD
jgi:hypothetical protein